MSSYRTTFFDLVHSYIIILNIVYHSFTPNVSTSATYPNVGCFISSPKNLGTAFTPSQYLTSDESDLSDENCAKYCAGKGSYMYAGLQMGCDANCYCIDSLEKFYPLSNASLCLSCAKANEKIPGILISQIGCTIVPPGLCPIISVLATCPQGFFNPPACFDRAKETCVTATGNNVATTSHDGNCTKCSLLNLAQFYPDINSNCDVLMDTPIVRDFRYSTDSSLGDGIKSIVKFLSWQNDLQPSNSDRTNGDQSEAASFGLHSNGVVVFVGLNQLPMALDPNQRVYFQHFWFRANAEGAFFFSLWQINQNFKQQYNQNNPVRSDIRDFEANLGTNYKEVFLSSKVLFDRKHDGVHQITNLNYPMNAGILSHLEFGYHTLDTAVLYGSKGSLQNNWEHSSLYCSYVYSFVANQPGKLVRGVPTYKNGYDRDWLPGWDFGKDVRVSASNYDWNNAHASVKIQNLNFYQNDSNDQFIHFAGLTLSTWHFDDCLFKFAIAIACPDYCARQQCGFDNKCTYGCQSGYYGSACQYKCPKGKYGPDCAQTCSATCQNTDCASLTGICTTGCLAGFTGSQCQYPCMPGFYGPHCSSKCSDYCITPNVCDKTTGQCVSGCEVGYQPPVCALPCLNGQYGQNCTQTCGYCKGGEPCNSKTGFCQPGCLDGYQPTNCKCIPGVWGDKCDKTCGQCKGEQPCDPETGFCNAVVAPQLPSLTITPGDVCDNNTNPPMCVCKYGNYGDNCDKKCGKCKNGFCLNNDGSCISGCIPGYTGNQCTTVCTPYKWGQDCQNTCGRCQQVCNNVDGTCGSFCDIGYKMPLCASCADKFWGASCNQHCGNCKSYKPCASNGWCQMVILTADQLAALPVRLQAIARTANTFPDLLNVIIHAIDSVDTNAILSLVNSVCVPGYQAPSCRCHLGFYGPTCSNACGHCLLGCIENGTCIGGCVAGYLGDKCTSPCPAGLFGPNCKFFCGHCFNHSVCTLEDGICKDGCEQGYMLPTCKCPVGFYAEDCKGKCGHCAVGTTCSFYDGSCEYDCDSGWRPPYCNCSLGTYGLDCSGTCGKCMVGLCDIYTGICAGLCQNGYTPPMCLTQCPPYWYGQSCQQVCGHCQDCAKCDPITGNCPGNCDPGYLLPDCIKACPIGFWGEKCAIKCGYCYKSDACDHVDGMCDRGCIQGYQSPLCVQQCPQHIWGFNCLTTCGYCLNQTSCSKLDGTCPNGCIEGYVPPFCILKTGALATSVVVCPTGYYVPPLCNQPCGHCLAGKACNGVNGFCEAGCAPGFSPLLCTQTCNVGMYGANCLQLCGKCFGGTCRQTDGVCPSGCQDGWFGDTCLYQSQGAVAADSAAIRTIDVNIQTFLFVMLMFLAMTHDATYYGMF